MGQFWRYLIMTLCVSVTSARVINSYGNENGYHGDLSSGAKEEKVLTPPSDITLNIDSDGFLGNSNEPNTADDCKEICSKGDGGGKCLCQWPKFLLDVFASMQNNNEFNKYEIIPFSKEDILNMEQSGLCKDMCRDNIVQPPCKCD